MDNKKTNIPKQIGHCLSCDADLWNDGVATRGGLKFYGSNEEFCGGCLQDQELAEMKDALKKAQEEFERLQSQKNEDEPLTECCGHSTTGKYGHPVYWNPYNKVIQCHACGQVYGPIK